ncbi:MAG: phosphoglycerate kinase [Phycisphaerae bacterium]
MTTLSNNEWSESLRRILFGTGPDTPTFDRALGRCPSFSNQAPIEPGSRILIRGDIDVPLDSSGESVMDDERLRTLREAIEVCTKLELVPVIMGHVGRSPDNTSAPIAPKLQELYARKCTFVEDWLDPSTRSVPPAAREHLNAAKPGELILLEQTRRYEIERALWDVPEVQLASETADLFGCARAVAEHIATSYVFEAIGSHNPDWSSVVLPGAMRQVYLGPYTHRELAGPLTAIRDADVVILSGLKADKLDAIEATVTRGSARLLICGGSLAMAFVKSRGGSIGQAEDRQFSKEKWFIPPERIEQARRILTRADECGLEIVVPVDFVLDDGNTAKSVPAGRTQRDVGPATRELFAKKILEFADARTARTKIFYNGAVGQFEEPSFAAGTEALVSFLCATAKARTDIELYIGGGDARFALRRFGDADAATHAFTCGGTVLKSIGDGKLNFVDSISTYAQQNAQATAPHAPSTPEHSTT